MQSKPKGSKPIAHVLPKQRLSASKVNAIIDELGQSTNSNDPKIAAVIPQNKLSFGYKLWKDDDKIKVTIYEGYVTLHGVSEELIPQTDIEPSGSPIYVFVEMDRTGGNGKINWSNSRPVTSMDKAYINLYEFINNGKIVYLSKVRNGGRDYNSDAIVR